MIKFSNFIDKIMSAKRQVDQSLLRTRCIKRNITTSDTNRPQTTIHKKIYVSNGYRSANASKSQTKINKGNLTTLEIRDQTYCRHSTKPKLKNIGKFLTLCKQENDNQEKIKRVETGKRLSIKNQEKMEEFIRTLMQSNNFFHILERTIVESIAILSTRENYEVHEKSKLPQQKIGFILYGKIKLYNKNIKLILNRGDTVGEHGLTDFCQQLKFKILQPTSILWLSFRNYRILKEQSITQGFRQQFNKLDTILRMSLIKKKFHHQ